MGRAVFVFLTLMLALGACGETRTRAPGTGTATTDGGTSGASDAGTATGEHAARCNQSCTLTASGPCASGATGECRADCSVVTDGVSAQCAACVLQGSGWAGRACTCYGTGCTLCAFEAGPTSCNGAAPDDTCAPEDEVCEGFDFARATSDECRDSCFPDGNEPDLTGTFAARCNRLCEKRAPACQGASVSECVTACMTQVSGLPSACGLCVVERSGWAGRACSCYGLGCNLCPFGPEPSACSSALPEDTCGGMDETCSGMEFAATTDPECADLCQ